MTPDLIPSSGDPIPLIDADGIPILHDLISPAPDSLGTELRSRLDALVAEAAAQAARQVEQQLREQLPRLLEPRLRELLEQRGKG